MLDFGQEMLLDEQVKLLMEERSDARASGDFQRADALRQELDALGVAVDDIVAAEAVENLEARLAAADQPGLPQLLEMLRGVRDRQAGELRELFDAAFALCDIFQ